VTWGDEALHELQILITTFPHHMLHIWYWYMKV